MTSIVYKPIGFTPLDLVKQFKIDNNITGKCAYAGRLDPMAHGKLVILHGDDLKKMDEITKKDKRYRFRMVLGISTDTTDILGLIDNSLNPKLLMELTEEVIESVKLHAQSFNNLEYNQEYHQFSSMTIEIDGKKQPMWKMFSDKSIDKATITIPKKTVNIYELNLLNCYKMSSIELKSLIDTNLSQLTSENFRLDDIKRCWNHYFSNFNDFNQDIFYYVLEYDAFVSSGTYIRQLVKDIGLKSNLPTMVIEIYRYETL